ncbi:MAG TPA: four helix bundle protein [Candidatus Angelobacter sp.]|jgi:four helix bundle protein|nr:four helix bundle protein [Candidatus Angelobacter sp.]
MGLEKHQELKERTKRFALRIIRMSQALPRNREANAISNQILRSATSVAANYRAAGRARSRAEFVAKLGVVIEEADETVFWLELLAEANIVKPERLRDLLDEGNELLAIFAASRRTAKS